MKKALSVLVVLSMLLALPPSAVFAAQAKEDIAQSRFFSVEESYCSYVERPNTAAQGDTSGAMQAIGNAIMGVAASVNISAYGILTSQMSGIITNEIYQNPAFFYLDGVSYSYSPATNIVSTVYFTYYFDTPAIQRMKANYETAVSKALAVIQSGMTNAEKALAIHDYLVLNAKYDYENQSAQLSQTAYGILVLGTGVCGGYSLAYKDLLSRLEIPVIKVTSISMSHAWNMVYLDGSWYHVDTTWDDPVCLTSNGWLNNDYDLEGRVGHTYFLLSDSAISSPDLNHHDWLPDSNTASNTQYDGDYASIKSGMFWHQGYWYYNSGGNLTRSLFNLSSSSVLKTINGADNTYSYLGVFNNEIYYNLTPPDKSKSEIRKCKFDGTGDTQVLLINNAGQTIKEKITELVIQTHRIKYTVYREYASSSTLYAVRYLALTAPAVYGVNHNGFYNTDRTITFDNGLTATLNGASFISGNTVSAAGTYTLIVTDSLCGTSATVTFTIDKTPPAAPTLSANPTTPTNTSVTVTITYPADAAVKEYKVGAGAWTAYTAPVILTANNTVYARCADTAGNVSAEGSIAVSNIDKTPPAAPTLSANPTTLTNTNVTVTITYPADAAVKEYKVGAGAWTAYTAPVILTANNTVYARCADAAGNISDTGSITITNIYQLIVHENSTAVINTTDNYIYGLAEGLTPAAFESGFVGLYGNVSFVYHTGYGLLGTGSTIDLINDETSEVIQTYTVILYGDVNGDGKIDSLDAGLLVDYENYIIVWNATNHAAMLEAADINGDGKIDSLDAGLVVDAENYLVTINQRTGIAG